MEIVFVMVKTHGGLARNCANMCPHGALKPAEVHLTRRGQANSLALSMLTTVEVPRVQTSAPDTNNEPTQREARQPDMIGGGDSTYLWI